MKNLLIVVDMQNDFIDQALGTEEAVKTVPEVVGLILDPAFDQVIATKDTHHEDYLQTLEGKKLPVTHCVENTEGWQINLDVEAALEKRSALVITKGTFGSERLASMVKEMKPEKITLCGLCTDICVISNGLLLRAALPDTPIEAVSAACAGTTKENHEAALAVMRSCQIDIR